MFTFHRIALEDRERIKKIYAEDGWEGCEYTFGNNILWGSKYYMEVAYIGDCCLVRYDRNYNSATGERAGAPNWMFSYPMGKGDKKAIIDLLIQDSQANHYPLFFNSVSEQARKDLMAWYPNRFFIQENRNYEDYIYLRERLAKLSGKKLHKKKTHTNRFKEQGDWSYESLDAHNIQDCLNFCKEWAEENADRWDDDMEEELHVVEQGLTLLEDLHLMGGLLRLNGKVVAFCIGEDHGDEMVVVHFEKALTRYPGTYQMINQQFALHLDESIKYINREDDTGNPGLRKAKLSYYPDILLKKYNALYSDMIFADPLQNREDILHIWKTVFGDSETFINEFIDKMVKEDTVILCIEDGKAVSMACFLPITIVESNTKTVEDTTDHPEHTNLTDKNEPLKENNHKTEIAKTSMSTDTDALYVYAVATLPEYRRKGYAGKMLAFAQEKLELPLVLCPAEESLYNYYEKQGFQTLFTDKTIEFPCAATSETERTADSKSASIADSECDFMTVATSETESATADKTMFPVIKNLSPAECKKLRDIRFSQPGYFKWNESTLNYIYYYYGGDNFRSVSIEDETGESQILMYNVSDDTLLIRESSLTEDQIRKLVPSLDGCASVTKAIQKLPGLMIKSPAPPKAGQGYFNFSLGD